AGLGPEAVQGEVGGFKAVGALVAALGLARAQLAKGGLPVDGENVLRAAIGWWWGRGRGRVNAAFGVGGAGAAIDGDPATIGLGAGDDDPEMGGASLVAGDQVIGRAGAEGDIAGIGFAADRLQGGAGFGGGEVAGEGDFCVGG